MISDRQLRFQRQARDHRVDFNVPLSEKGRSDRRHAHPRRHPHHQKVLTEGSSGDPDVAHGTSQKNRSQILARADFRRRKTSAEGLSSPALRLGEKAAEMAKTSSPDRLCWKTCVSRRGGGQARGLAENASKEEKDAAKKALKEGPQKEFVKKLASLADCYINDAFGTATASTLRPT